MNDFINQLNLNFEENFSILNFVINIVICGLLLFCLRIIYIKYGGSISNRSQLSKVLMLVGVTTFIIISIVKSSLALSLGLVGALSIVRFRTAIKEPEELGYFFIAISIGLGLGANQLLPTIIGFIFLTLIIVLFSKKKLNNSFTQNLLINLNCKETERSKITDQISAVVTGNSKQVDVKRIKYSKEEISFNFLINVSSLDTIKKINDQLININNSIDITFVSNDI
ncbi:DUF4956 domain-containing protein [Aquimarina sp. AU474]|uniref:DUF4956 domain-containing protein n=1 Tax=Aquimarina sp. AU474 TaxID=2108529 RepID=UPI000D68BEE8|nr:DUF4956 domain-containing protein [Aquimarina sp. AU474]